MLREDLLPVYQEEFAKAMTVEYISNSIEAGDVDKVLEFEKKVLKLKLVDILLIYREEKPKFKKIRWGNKMVELDGVSISVNVAISILLKEISYKIRSLYDECIVQLIGKSIRETSYKRCAIEEVVFNFSSCALSNSIMDLLALGANYVFNEIENTLEANKKYEFELLLLFSSIIIKLI